MKIAVVDDNESVRESLVAVLEAASHSTESFASAEAFLASEPIDNHCILVDYTLTGANGCELVHSLRAKNDNVPVILISGNLDAEIADEVVGFENISILRKPCTIPAILDSINRIVEIAEESNR